ncbi:P-loop containing nucleoside triphosphate hydrolase protein [Rutstroemia sp. NJR-2017a BBW]|nr:P-loop containing nucleoside triphosphate hydrolase protein [Rutstroemia sp. NJR-2017a BBW]
MLPNAIPTARIIHFGYESGWYGTAKDEPKKTQVSDVAEMLLKQLELHRRNITRPIIFIAHSYGGLVLMQALRRSFENPNEWSSPFRYTAGLIFFGTPFRGRKGLTLEEIVKAVAQSDPHLQIYKETMALSVEENPYLQDIVYRFTETRRVDHPIPLWCFYETKPSPIGKVYKDIGLEDEYVVPKESACLDTSKGVERYPLERNHYNLQKFPGPLDPGYLVVKNAIMHLADGARNYLRECSMRVDFEQFTVGLNFVSSSATQFVGREKELSKMHELLQDHRSRSCVILHGLGGIGKTQLAITYARRQKEKYTAIFWLNANNEDSLKLSFRDVAQQVLRYHPSTSILSSVDQNKDLDQVVSVVKDWLDSPRNTR